MRSGAPSILVKVNAPSTKVPLGEFAAAYEANSARGVTVTVTVVLDVAGTVTDSDENVRSMPAPAQLVARSWKYPPSIFSDSACPPRV